MNYDAAISALENDNKSSLHTWTPACNGVKLSQLHLDYDKVSGLEALGVDASGYGSLLIPVIMAKLPRDVGV